MTFPNSNVLLILLWPTIGCFPDERKDGGSDTLPVDDTDADTDSDTDADSDTDTVPDDVDGDGYRSFVDCDDNDPTVNPGALEICGDGIDNDCRADATCGWDGLDADDADAIFYGEGTSSDRTNTNASTNFGYAVQNAGDVTGDGVPDLLVGAPGQIYYGDTSAGHTYYLGGASYLIPGGNYDGLTATADFRAITTTWTADTYTNRFLGTRTAGTGDTNGDGYSDFAVLDPYARSSTTICSDYGSIYLQRGSSLVETEAADAPLTVSADATSRIIDFTAGGDLTGDGGGDIAAMTMDYTIVGSGANATCNFSGYSVRVYSATGNGAVSGGAYTARVTFPYREGEQNTVISSVAVGDVDGNGVADLLTGFRNAYPDTSGVYLWLGPLSAEETVATADLVISDTSGMPRGTEVPTSTAIVEDLTGDGKPDIAFGVQYDYNLGLQLPGTYIVEGTLRGTRDLWPSAYAFLYGGTDIGLGYAGSTLSAGDLNGDGNTDLVIGTSYPNPASSPSPNSFDGAVTIVPGPVLPGVSALSDYPTVWGVSGGFGSTLAVADFDNDGRDDLAVGAPSAYGAVGLVYMFNSRSE